MFHLIKFSAKSENPIVYTDMAFHLCEYGGAGSE